jgi:hypothetical protein
VLPITEAGKLNHKLFHSLKLQREIFFRGYAICMAGRGSVNCHDYISAMHIRTHHQGADWKHMVAGILLGTNDSKPYRWDAWGGEFPLDYQAIIDTFRLVNPAVRFILCDPPPIWEGHPYGTNFSDRQNDSILVNHIMPVITHIAGDPAGKVSQYGHHGRIYAASLCGFAGGLYK